MESVPSRVWWLEARTIRPSPRLPADRVPGGHPRPTILPRRRISGQQWFSVQALIRTAPPILEVNRGEHRATPESVVGKPPIRLREKSSASHRVPTLRGAPWRVQSCLRNSSHAVAGALKWRSSLPCRPCGRRRFAQPPRAWVAGWRAGRPSEGLDCMNVAYSTGATPTGIRQREGIRVSLIKSPGQLAASAGGPPAPR